MSLTPMTELDAVNLMLGAIHEAPVSSLDDPDFLDAVLARDKLRIISREFQSQGWHFNTERGVVLLPNTSGELMVPSDALRVDTVSTSADVDVVVRGSRLYDVANQTYTFTDPATVTIVRGLSWDELPATAREYIAHAAANALVADTMGSDQVSQMAARRELMASAVFKRDDCNQAGRSLRRGLGALAGQYRWRKVSF